MVNIWQRDSIRANWNQKCINCTPPQSQSLTGQPQSRPPRQLNPTT